jgi:hypothetical protein
MIVNLIDLRSRPYRWKSVLAVCEAAVKDNEAEDSDVISPGIGVDVDYAERDDISVREAMLWAEQLGGLVTLRLYDRDEEADLPDV